MMELVDGNFSIEHFHQFKLPLTTHFACADFGHTVFETIKITLVRTRTRTHTRSLSLLLTEPTPVRRSVMSVF